MEMGPGGLKINPLHYTGVHWSTWPLTAEERARIIDAMDEASHDKLEYNWLADLYIGLREKFGLQVQRWVWRVNRWRKDKMCSQLVDYIYLQAGVHLFEDGRLPGEVSPADLRRLGP